ncbi:lysylphosphatidylglycerol synthase domain-containing protein [Streptomyces sp. NPDC058674]|uniref:lysylphosphatidylglycerol synthase domain-containing protein n=1 Tax=Streptomyces sp. NPDC058674 TaxID=3346592 RepID=UPI00365714AC
MGPPDGAEPDDGARPDDGPAPRPEAARPERADPARNRPARNGPPQENPGQAGPEQESSGEEEPERTGPERTDSEPEGSEPAAPEFPFPDQVRPDLRRPDGDLDLPAGAEVVTYDHGPGPHGHAPTAADRVEVDEPLLAARVHRPSDLVRLLVGILGIAVVLAIAAFAHGTTAGLQADIKEGTGAAPDLLIKVAALVSSIAVLLLPVAFAIERLIKRDGLRIADGVLAAVLAHGVTLATDLWVSQAAPATIQEALTRPAGAGGALTDPVHGYLAPVIAYMTAVGMTRRPRWRVALWVVLLLDAFTMLVSGYTTAFSIILTVLLGWSVAYGTLYAVGSPNVRPTGHTLLAGLRRVGFRPVSAMRAEVGDGPEATEVSDRGRRYHVTLEDGPPLDVTVVDREQQAQGFFYRVWRRLTLRGITTRRSLQSLRQALEQEALLAYAAIAAGANAPKLIATSELGPDAVMLVYEHLGGRTMDSIPDEEITHDLSRNAWEQVRALQSRRIAHRRLTGDALVVDRSGSVILTDLRGGEIAAGDLVLRMDIAQLLTTLGLRVGARRSVASAVSVLGPDAVADCLPLLQPIALSRSTRATLRRLARERAEREREAVLESSRAAKAAREADAAAVSASADRKAEKKALDDALEGAREEDLLSQIRQQVLLIRPQAPVEPARLERIRPRTLVSFIAGAFGAYFLLTQLAHVPLAETVGEAQWGWVGAALAFSALSYFAAAMSLLGFVPERVPFLRTVLAQVAGSFVKLVAPAAVGGVALNTRFLQRAGVRPGLAVASVGASQLFGLASHILLLLSFGYLTGTEKTPEMTPSRTVIAGLLTVAVLVLVVTAVPFMRKFVVTRVRALFAGVVPRMLDVLQRPQKLVTGIGGMLLLTGCFVMCLDASIRAFGGGQAISYASIAVVFLAGNALGSAAPTPGGMGAVEATLTLGLVAAGLEKEVAISAVLLFRLVTFWLPVLPGWISFNFLTRKEAI